MLSSIGSRIRAGIAGAAVIVAASTGGAFAVTGDSYTVGYKNIFPINQPSEGAVDPYVGGFSTTVLDLGSGMVRISFKNGVSASGFTGTVGDVYVDDALGLLSNDVRNDGNVGTVNFKDHNGAFPQGNKVGFSESFAYKKNGDIANGINVGEAFGVKFSGLFDSLVAAIKSGDLTFGMHVQTLAGGASDSIVSGTSPVPVPAPVILLLAGLGVAAFATRGKRADA